MWPRAIIRSMFTISICRDVLLMAAVATIPRLAASPWVSGPNSAFLSRRFPRLLATDCALHGASLFFVCGSPPGAKKSKQKKAPPGIRVSLRSTPLLPEPLRGPSRRDVPAGRPRPSFLARRPCLARPCATPPLLASLALRASLRLLLRFATFRPTDGEFARMKVSSFRQLGLVGIQRCRSAPETSSNATTALPSSHHEFGPGSGPVRRLSGIDV